MGTFNKDTPIPHGFMEMSLVHTTEIPSYRSHHGVPIRYAFFLNIELYSLAGTEKAVQYAEVTRPQFMILYATLY